MTILALSTSRVRFHADDHWLSNYVPTHNDRCDETVIWSYVVGDMISHNICKMLFVNALCKDTVHQNGQNSLSGTKNMINRVLQNLEVFGQEWLTSKQSLVSQPDFMRRQCKQKLPVRTYVRTPVRRYVYTYVPIYCFLKSRVRYGQDFFEPSVGYNQQLNQSDFLGGATFPLKPYSIKSNTEKATQPIEKISFTSKIWY